MAYLNMAAAQESLKLYYLDGLRYQLNTACPVLAIMERDSESVVGSEIRMAVRYGRSGGIGNRTDDGLLPIPNSRKTKQARWETKNIFARIHISDKTMRASRSREGAFVNLLEAELEDAQTDAKDALCRQVFGSNSGIMATVTAAAGPGNTAEVSNANVFFEGQLVDVLTSSVDDTPVVTQREVTVVDHSTSTITLSGATFSVVIGNIITLYGNFDEELTGFGDVFTENNTLYGIDRATNQWFNPTVIPVGGEISEVEIQQAIDDAEMRAGGQVNALVSSYGVRRAYQNLLLATKRTVEVMNLRGGYKALTYNDQPFIVDKYAPAQTLFGLDLDTWRVYHIMDWDWLSEDGNILHRVTDRPVWEATLARYMDLGCSRPKSNFKMTGIVEH